MDAYGSMSSSSSYLRLNRWYPSTLGTSTKGICATMAMVSKESLQRERLVSLDVFRGATIAAMILVNDAGDWDRTYAPLLHAEWNGWTPTDLIFPFFLFIVGVAIPYAFAGRLERSGGDRSPLHRQIVRRALILLALGLFLNWFPFYSVNWPA